MANELTAILFALHREADPFRRVAGCVHRVDAPVSAWRNERGLLVVLTGMGAEGCRVALDWLLRAHRPTRVISAGFCGSLVEAYRVGASIRPAAIIDEDDPPYQGPGIALVSVRTPVLGTEARRRLHETTRAAIVDMESATVRAICEREGIGFDCLRVVSDDLGAPLPPELPRIVTGERLLLLRLVSAIVRRPTLLIDLVRLARHSRNASGVLAQGLLGLTSDGLDRGLLGPDAADDGSVPPPLGLCQR